MRRKEKNRLRAPAILAAVTPAVVAAAVAVIVKAVMGTRLTLFNKLPYKFLFHVTFLLLYILTRYNNLL